MSDGKQVLVVISREPGLRSEIIGWTAEDASLYVVGKPIGYTPPPKRTLVSTYAPQTIMEALYWGWKLLAPPTYIKSEAGWEWWLTR